MNTSSSFLNSRLGVIAFIGIALTSSVWAGPGATIDESSSSSSNVAPMAEAKRAINAVYPYELIIQGKAGWAETNFVIDYAGRPLFATASGASDPAFAKAAIAMVEANEFATIKKNKRAVMASASLHFNFSGEATLDPEARRVLAELRKPQPAICSLAELDERPKALRQDSPVYPRALKDDGLTGQAEVEFVVGADGRVYFPKIISASQEDFGWAAAAAIAQWRFQSPTKNGKQVDVRMTVPVLFDARKLAAAD
jgi:TonB family protein